MARICIPDHEYKERVKRCAAILVREKLDVLIVNGNLHRSFTVKLRYGIVCHTVI